MAVNRAAGAVASNGAMPAGGCTIRCENCAMRGLCLPTELDRDELAQLDAIVLRRRKIRCGGAIYRTGERFRSLVAVRAGFFKTARVTPNGSEQIGGFYLPGDLMGLDAIAHEMHRATAVALSDAEVCELPYAPLEQLMGALPKLQRRFHRMLSSALASEHNIALQLGGLQARERIVVFLLNLSARLAARGAPPHRVVLPMSRAAIGNYLGLTIETVSRMLSHLQQQGLISVRQRAVVFRDLAALDRIAAGHAP